MKGSPSGGPFFCKNILSYNVPFAIQQLYLDAFLTYRYLEQ